MTKPIKERPSSQRQKIVLELLATVIQHERFQEAASAFVTVLAIRFGCDRVGLGFVGRRRTQLQMISHTAHFEKKGNLVRAIEAAMEEALDQELTINVPDNSGADGNDTRITRAHKELARRHGSGSICSIPTDRSGEDSAVLTLERPGNQPFEAETVQLCETALNMAAPLLALKRSEERPLITKAWASLQKTLQMFLGRGHLGWKLAGVSVVSLILFLCYATAPYRVSAKTLLEASIQRAAVAPFDGYVKDAPHRAGDVLRQGDVLCTLDDRFLKLDLRKRQSEREQLLKERYQALADLDETKVSIVAAQLKKAEAQLALATHRLSRTEVLVPFDGVVVRGDLSQSIGAPVERGEVLFEVAPLDSYRVILEVDERDVAQVSVGRQGHLILSAFPGKRLPFSVRKITPVSITSEGRNYFRVEAELNAESGKRLRPGMEGIGKIDIEERLLVWIWTHRAIDWLRLTLWSWLA